MKKRISDINGSNDCVITIPSDQVHPLSPHHRAIHAVGEALIRESLTTGQEFCKFMIRTCSGAIPLYIAILSFVMSQGNNQAGVTLLAVIPSLLYLMAMVLFVAGYLPAAGGFAPDVIEEIEEFREKCIRRRHALIKLGFTFFLFATLWASMVIIGCMVAV